MLIVSGQKFGFKFTFENSGVGVKVDIPYNSGCS